MAPSLESYAAAVGAYRAYISPLVALIGVLGNILVILVFCQERQKSRFSIYCIAFALTHIVCLVMNSFLDDFFGRGLLYATNGTFSIKLDVYSEHMCRFMEYVPNVMYIISSFLMVVFSLDRTLTIFKPMTFYSVYYKSLATGTCCAVVVIAFLLNIPHLVGLGLIHPDNDVLTKKCDFLNSNAVVSTVSIRMKVLVAFIIPTLLVLVLNILICLKLWRVRFHRQKLLPGDSKGSTLEMNRVVGHLAVSNAFLFLTLPLVIVMILRQIDDATPRALRHPYYRTSLKIFSRLFSSIKDINYAVDFFLYCFFLGNFRWRLLKRVCASCLRQDWFVKSQFGTVIERKLCRYDQSRRRRSTVSALAHAIHPVTLASIQVQRASVGSDNCANFNTAPGGGHTANPSNATCL